MAKAKPNLVLGIDAGLRGALGAVTLTGKFHSWHRMPVREDSRGRKTIDVHGLYVLLNAYVGKVAAVVTEAQHSYGNEARSRLWRFALGVGRMQATVELIFPGVPFVDFSPQAWKEAVLGDKSMSKVDTVDWVRARFPDAELPRADGPSDALGQALFGIEVLKRST